MVTGYVQDDACCCYFNTEEYEILPNSSSIFASLGF